MGNKKIEKTFVDGEYLRKEIRKAGYSIKRLSENTSRSDRQIREYLKNNSIPIKVLDEIFAIIHPRNKTIWVRLGVTVPVSEEELYEMMDAVYNPETGLCWDYDCTDDQSIDFLKRAVADGESYIPYNCFYEHLKWFRERKAHLDAANSEKSVQ